MLITLLFLSFERREKNLCHNHIFCIRICKKRFQVNFTFKVIAKNYQCEIFEGNACRKLIENSDRLLDPELYNDSFLVMPYVVILRNYNKAVHDCFSTAKISPDTKRNIDSLYTKENF